jgi:hypothetical protein
MPPKRKAQPEEPRRGHAAIKHNADLAEQFGINVGPDPPRQLVKVDFIPTPLDVEQPESSSRGKKTVDANPEDSVITILREEMDELRVRLERFGVPFTAAQQQDVVDYAMSRLMGYGGGGAIARR